MPTFIIQDHDLSHFISKRLILPRFIFIYQIFTKRFPAYFKNSTVERYITLNSAAIGLNSYKLKP